jgi:hypothetical protein
MYDLDEAYVVPEIDDMDDMSLASAWSVLE